MPKYEVTYKETTEHRCVIEADTPDEVKENFNLDWYLGWNSQPEYDILEIKEYKPEE